MEFITTQLFQQRLILEIVQVKTALVRPQSLRKTSIMVRKDHRWLSNARSIGAVQNPFNNSSSGLVGQLTAMACELETRLSFKW